MKQKNERKAECDLWGVIIVGVVIFICVQPIQAIPITIQIEAVVDTVEDDGNYLEGQVDVCDVITGYYTYESTTSDTNPSDYVGDYEHSISPYGIFLSVGGFDFQTDLSNVDFLVEIVNNNAGLDAYGIRSYNNLSISNGALVDYISWSLQDSTLTAFTNDDLLLTPPILSDWDFNHLRLEGDKSNSFLVDAHVTLATPEPTTVLFLIFGAMALRKRCH